MKSLLLFALLALKFTSALRQELEESDTTKSKRGALAGKAAQMGVQKAIEKGDEMFKKNLKLINEQRERADAFRKKKVKFELDSSPGWNMTDLFVPSGYNLRVDSETGDNKDDMTTLKEDPPYVYANGFVGPAIMNGCYGSGYLPGDPCYAPSENTTQCRNMMEGAGFIGVGFDGRGGYSPESRRMSIIQRNCAAKSTFGGEDVPDTMNVFGIYDTSAYMSTFSSRSEYRQYLQQESGTSGSFFGFYAGVKTAWGSSTGSASQSFLCMFDIDVVRYEIFKDEVKPSDLSQAFLREFNSLPRTYFEPRAPLAFQNFIQRWGTHYIKSAKFGGQLEFRKMMQGSSTQTKAQAQKEAEVSYRAIFFSAEAKSKTKKGNFSKSEQKSSSTSIFAQGGDQEIAAILSDMYSPTFKTEFKSWLKSIPKYPKAFKFQMSPITDLLDFRAGDLFPDKFTTGCDLGRGNTFFTRGKDNAKVHCNYKSRKDLEEALKDRFRSLKRAIEGPKSVSDMTIPAGQPGCETGGFNLTGATTYSDIKTGVHSAEYMLIKFDMSHSIIGNKTSISKNMIRRIKFKDNKWWAAEKNGVFYLYNTFEGGTEYQAKNYVNFEGLVMKYEDGTGLLEITDDSYKKSKNLYPLLKKQLKGMVIAILRNPPIELPVPFPCNVKWNNMNMFQRTKEGKCLVFTAASAGPVYVVFAAIPYNKKYWYWLEISLSKVALYKFKTNNFAKIDSTTNKMAVGLGESRLFQTYFVCVKEAERSTVIEYGKTQGTGFHGDVYLSVIDKERPHKVAYYAFGTGESDTEIANVHVIEGRVRLLTKCKGSTSRDVKLPYCLPKQCNQQCDQLQGCSASNNPRKCDACLNAKEEGVCISACTKANTYPVGKDKNCTACSTPLGMENGGIQDARITSSSQFDVKHGPRLARLNNTPKNQNHGSWVSGVNKAGVWLQIDLGHMTHVTAIATQGRPSYSQWVKTYKIKYSTDIITWKDYQEGGNTKVFKGNSDRNTIVSHKFSPPIFAKRIRIVVVTWNTHIALRAELYGCTPYRHNLSA